MCRLVGATNAATVPIDILGHYQRLREFKRFDARPLDEQVRIRVFSFWILRFADFARNLPENDKGQA
jgi:hypothetical protein